MIIDKRSKYSKGNTKVMDKVTDEDDCEYNRLGSEQLMRIDKIYSLLFKSFAKYIWKDYNIEKQKEL